MKTLAFSKRLSLSDQTILLLAYQGGNLVLTGDQMIRKWCVRHGLQVHGILWVLDQFVTHELLTCHQAIKKLKDLMRINIWLPIAECEDLMKEWENKGSK